MSKRRDRDVPAAAPNREAPAHGATSRSRGPTLQRTLPKTLPKTTRGAAVQTRAKRKRTSPANDPKAGALDNAAIQRRRTTARADDGEAIHAQAARGVSGSGGKLPHIEPIQEAFGHHDVTSVRAHVGGKAADAADAIGAEAYATGDRVAFRDSPDLHTAAHEAAHVVQQRDGVQLSGGVGRAGDAYEQHADDVADAVVAGRSAAHLLDSAPGSSGPDVQRRTVQRRESEAAEADDADRYIVYALDEDGNNVELPVEVAAELSASVAGGIQETRASLLTALSIYDSLPDGIVAGISSWRGGAEKPDLDRGREAERRLTEAHSNSRITSRQGIRVMNLQNAKWLYELACDDAEEVVRQIYEYREATIGGAEAAADDLRLVRNVSFAIAGSMATAGAGTAAVKTYGLSKGSAALVSATVAGGVGAGTEIVEYLDEWYADPSKRFSLRELGGNAAKGFIVGFVSELAGSLLRDKIRVLAFGDDAGVLDAVGETLVNSGSTDMDLVREFVKRQAVELVADVGEDVLERFVEGTTDAILDPIFAQGEFSLDQVLEAYASAFAEWNPFKAMLQERCEALFDLGIEAEIEVGARFR